MYAKRWARQLPPNFSIFTWCYISRGIFNQQLLPSFEIANFIVQRNAIIQEWGITISRMMMNSQKKGEKYRAIIYHEKKCVSEKLSCLAYDLKKNDSKITRNKKLRALFQSAYIVDVYCKVMNAKLVFSLKRIREKNERVNSSWQAWC